MAKQPDKRKRDDDPKPGKGKPIFPPQKEEALDLSNLESGDYEILEAVEAGDEAEPVSPKKTKLANKSPQPTMLAHNEEEVDSAKKTKLAKKSPQPTMLAPEEEEPVKDLDSAKKTKLAKKSPQPTMLAPEEKPELTPRAKQPAAIPDLSIDDLEEVVAAAPASDVIDAEVAEVVEAAPVSDVLDADLAEVIETASASGVLDAEVEAAEIIEAAPSSAVLGAEVEEIVGQPSSKPPSSVVEAAAIVEEADEVLADEVLEVQQASGTRKGPETPPLKPASGVKEETPSGSIFSEEILEVAEPSNGRESPTGSLDVFTAEIQDVGGPGSGTQHDEDVDLFGDGPASGSRKSKKSSAARAAESAIGVGDDEIFSADTIAEDFAADASSMQMKKPAKKKDEEEEKVLDVTETLPQVGGSSAIQWDDIGQVSDAKKKLDDEETIAFDTVESRSASKRGKKDSALDMDEVSEVIEEIDESEVEPPSKKKKISEEDIDFDDLVTEEEAAPSSKSGAKKAKADDEEIEEIAADMFADEDGDHKPISKKPSKVLVDDEVEEIEEVADSNLEEEPISSRRGGTALKRPPKPKYGRRWLGGIFLGFLLTAGGVAAVGYFKPELIEQGLAYSPEHKKAEPKKELSESLQARESIEGGNFEQAIAVLDNAPKTPPNRTALAEARWLKYVDEKKDKIKRDDPEVKQILSHLDEAKGAKNAQALKKQIVAFFQTKDLSEQITKLQRSDKTLAEVAKLLKDPKDLPAAVAQVITESDANKKLVDEFADALVKGMFLAKEDKEKLDGPAFQKIVKDLAEKQGVLAAVNKVLEDAMIKDPGDKGVTALVMAKKDVEDKLTAVDKLLAEEKLEPGAKGLQALFKARKKLTVDRDSLDKAIKAAFQELADAKVVPADADPRTKIAEGTKLLRQKAESPLTLPLTALAGSLSGLGTGTGGLLQKGFDYAALMAELSYYRVREPLLRGPEKNIDTHIALLLDPANFSNAAAVEAALKEADWLLSETAKSSPDTKGKAYLVQALALRHKQQFDEARTTLAQAIKLGQDGKATGAWLKQGERMEAELTDPAAYFLPRAQQLATAGNVQGAQNILTLGLKAIPNHGLLLAQRAQLRLDSIRGKVSVEAGQTIRSDAEAAAKDATSGAAAAFVLGQLSEREGDWASAEKYYRQALKSHLGDADSGSRYRAALARVLLQDRPAVSTPVEPNEKGKDKNKDKDEPKDKNKDKDEPKDKDGVKDKDAVKDKDKGKDKDAAKDKDKGKEKDLDKDKKEPDPKKDADGSDQARLDMQTMLVLALVGVQAGLDDDEDPVVAARIKESIELANELVKSANPKVKGEGYLLLGQAMAKQGKRTEGLKEFSRGLELLYPGIATKEMTKLIDEHPAFQQPDVSKQPNQFLAEQFFGRGLHFYFEKKYEPAEKQFQQAVRHFGQDARYRYFLGLAQLAQKTKLKRDAAYFSFEEGARLEAANRPFVADINISLERIQGDLRQQLNGFRQKGVEKSE